MKSFLIILAISCAAIGFYVDDDVEDVDDYSDVFWSVVKSSYVDHFVQEARFLADRYGCPNKKQIVDLARQHKSEEFEEMKKRIIYKLNSTTE